LGVWIDWPPPLVGLGFVRVEGFGATLWGGEAVSFHGGGDGSGGGRGGNHDRRSWRRIDHALIAGPLDTDMVGPRKAHGKRYRQQADRERARPLLVTSHHRLSFRSPPRDAGREGS